MFMDITRNQFFYAGLVLLFLGIQFRAVESVELSPELTQQLGGGAPRPLASVGAGAQSLAHTDKPLIKKMLRPPDWIGWSLLSAGAVLILHSWAMQKPSG